MIQKTRNDNDRSFPSMARVKLIPMAVLALALAGCKRADDSATQTAQPSNQFAAQQPVVQPTVVQQPAQPAAAQQPAPEEFFVGDTVTAGSLQVTLNDVRTGTQINGTIDTATAAEGGEYVVLVLKLKNVGSSPIAALDMPDINLVDANGNKYSSDIDASVAAGSLLGDDSKAISDLNPDLAVTKVEAFEVSRNIFDADTWRLRIGDDLIYHLVGKAPLGSATQNVSAQPSPDTGDTPRQQQTFPAGQTAPPPQAVDSQAPDTATPDCANMAGCMAASLNAARQENVDALRHVASIIDGFPKPDPGNRTVANELNARALAALKGNDYATAEPLLEQAYRENPHNAEIVANYGYALTHLGKADAALQVLQQAVLLDPRRTSTWVPVANALAAAGHTDDAIAALWIGWQWSTDRDRALAFYATEAGDQSAPVQASVYAQALAWVKDGQRPSFNGQK